MQQKEQNISPIKQRILHFVDGLGITKRDFYEKTGISRGTLESPTGITEDTLTKFFATYTDINPVWVLTGSGYQAKTAEFEVVSDINVEYRTLDPVYQDIITRKITKIERLSGKIERLKSEVNILKIRI